MKYNDRQFIDRGYDANQDKHCDLDGWFVNRRGHHAPHELNVNIANSKGLLIPEDMKRTIHDSFYNIWPPSIDQKNAVRIYTKNDSISFSSGPLNHALRNGFLTRDQVVQEYKIEKAIQRYVVKKDITVFRGISGKRHDPKLRYLIEAQKGDVIMDKAFVSTTISIAHATTFAKNVEDFDLSIMMEIRLKKGDVAAPTEQLTAYHQNEYEILLNNRQKMKVLEKDVDRIKGKTLVYLVLELENDF
ncbi:MAG: ADP-ribosyltransferase [Bacilli bacterium]|nr:ADP-ribosyltransferase [Bacilli bacterium]